MSAVSALIAHRGTELLPSVATCPSTEAELDRLHPERVAMRATTPDGLREGWAAVEAMWQPTIELAHRLPEPTLHQRVDGEWSLVETLRHLIFVTDGWFSRTVLGEADPYHPFGILPTFLTAEAANLGIDEGAAPSFSEVLDVRAARIARVRDDLATRRRPDPTCPSGSPHNDRF